MLIYKKKDLRAAVAVVVVLGKKPNDEPVDAAVDGANENVPAVAGFDVAKPKDVAVGAVLVAGNSDVLPPIKI